MPLFEILKQKMSALWETKRRSFLTMFGIIWGITSVILLVGFSIDQQHRLQSISTDIAICFPGETGMPSGGYAADRDITLTVDDSVRRTGARFHCAFGVVGLQRRCEKV